MPIPGVADAGSGVTRAGLAAARRAAGDAFLAAGAGAVAAAATTCACALLAALGARWIETPRSTHLSGSSGHTPPARTAGDAITHPKHTAAKT